MDEVSTKAKLVDAAESAPGLTVTLPRSEVDEALQAGEGESELLLDVVRATNGHKEQRRVAVAWDRADLERLARGPADSALAGQARAALGRLKVSGPPPGPRPGR